MASKLTAMPSGMHASSSTFESGNAEPPSDPTMEPWPKYLLTALVIMGWIGLMGLGVALIATGHRWGPATLTCVLVVYWALFNDRDARLMDRVMLIVSIGLFVLTLGLTLFGVI